MRYFNKFEQFDDVTTFRLINAFLVAISMSILAPVMIVLKGLYMLPWVISLFSIAYMLAVKTNRYLVPLGNETLYRLGIFIHILFILVTLIYFYNPMIMIYADAVIVFFEVVIFSAYSVTLTNYITEFYPISVPEFQIIKNSTWADGSIIGLLLATVCTFISLNFAIYVFLAFNTCFSFYMICNWNFFKVSLK